jgi:hypothetical protein
MTTTTKKTKKGGEGAIKSDLPGKMNCHRSLEEYIDYMNAKMQTIRAQIRQKNAQPERAP